MCDAYAFLKATEIKKKNSLFFMSFHDSFSVTQFFFLDPQNVPMEEAGSSPRPESPGTLTETEGDAEAGLPDVDLDGYQTTLEEVLTWLLSAEDTLQIQDEVSDDVEEVKEQFHTHEVRVANGRICELHRSASARFVLKQHCILRAHMADFHTGCRPRPVQLRVPGACWEGEAHEGAYLAAS